MFPSQDLGNATAGTTEPFPALLWLHTQRVSAVPGSEAPPKSCDLESSKLTPALCLDTPPTFLTLGTAAKALQKENISQGHGGT